MKESKVLKATIRTLGQCAWTASRRPALAAVLAAEHAVAQRRVRHARAAHRANKWIIGSFYGKPNGLTRGAQLQLDAMHRAGYCATQADGSGRRASAIASAADANLVLHTGAPESARLINRLGIVRSSLYTIGYWAWELPDPPRDWKRYQDIVSEVWTPSTFSADSLARLFDLPVYVVPHRVAPEPRRVRDPKGKFTVLTMADSRSSFDRKNPIGAITAFRAAFGDRTDVRLIVKLLGRPRDVTGLLEAVSHAANIVFVTERLGLDQLRDLYRSSDVLLSMHRAEGFGLPLLEAMAHGLPTVATGWSGNTDFMSAENSVLVPYDLRDVHDRAGVYRYASKWADPDLSSAAEALRGLETDHNWYESLSIAAHGRAQQLTTFRSPWEDQRTQGAPK